MEMKHVLLALSVMLALSACKEDEGSDTADNTASSSEASENSSAAEDTATADDGRGAMDGASENGSTAMTTSEVSQDAIDACIDGLRATAGASGGTVESTEFSEANSLVMLRQSSGGLWRCIVSNDGSSASLEAVEGTAGGGDGASADDGGGAMDGASAETETPSAGSSTDVSDFVGAPAGQASGGLQALGFESIRTEGLTTYWFNRDTGACARITTSEGVFSEVVMLPAEDC